MIKTQQLVYQPNNPNFTEGLAEKSESWHRNLHLLWIINMKEAGNLQYKQGLVYIMKLYTISQHHVPGVTHSWYKYWIQVLNNFINTTLQIAKEIKYQLYIIMTDLITDSCVNEKNRATGEVSNLSSHNKEQTQCTSYMLITFNY